LSRWTSVCRILRIDNISVQFQKPISGAIKADFQVGWQIQRTHKRAPSTGVVSWTEHMELDVVATVPESKPLEVRVVHWPSLGSASVMGRPMLVNVGDLTPAVKVSRRISGEGYVVSFDMVPLLGDLPRLKRYVS
jgi:hypothetical protein